MRKRRSRETVAGFRAALPGATIYVYDNNSRDRTVEIARGGGRDRPHRAPAGQGPCRPPHVRRRRRRRLRHGRRRSDLRSQGRRRRWSRCWSTSSSTWSSARASTRSTDAYRGGHVLGNRLFTGLLARPVRAQLHRHFLGLPGLFAALRQKLPGAVGGVRDRDRDERPRARAEDAGRRGRHRLWRAARRLGIEAVDLSRRLADPEDDRDALPDRAAGAVLRRDRRAAADRRARARGAAGPDLPRHRAGPALPDRDPRHRA